MKALKQLCTPRKSVFDVSKRDTVLNLTHLTDDKISAAEFFEENSVTEGMRTLLIEAHRRLQGKSSQAVFKLTQAMGGGKTHNLIALGLFAGLRPAEISRLTWEKISLDEGSITIDGSMAKTRQRRIVKLSANAIAWLEPYAVSRPPFTFTNFQRDFAKVKNGAKFNGKEGTKGLRAWVPDYMRHTALSNHFAHNKHEGETASWAGNSPNVIHRHYKALVKEADAKEFWEITPDNVAQIIPMPTTAAAAAK